MDNKDELNLITNLLLKNQFKILKNARKKFKL